MRALFLGHTAPTPASGGAGRYVEKLGDELARLGVARAHAPDVPDLAAFDVVHVTGPDSALVRAVRHARHPRLAVTFHGSPLGLARHGWRTGRRGVYRAGQLAVYAADVARTSAIMARADAVVPVSACTAASLARQFPPARAKTFLNENGADVTRFTPEGAGDDAYVLFVGRLERSKGVDALVRALSGTSRRLVVAGTGALDAELRRAAGPNVEFAGGVDDARLLALYRRASGCVFPSLYEGYGLVALEALACGTPTAVSDAFCVRGPAGALLERFPVGDDAAMRAAVERLAGVKTAEWSRRAHETVARHHDVRARARELVHLYESLASGKGVPRPERTL